MKLKEYAGTLGLGQYALKTDVTEAVGAVQKTLGVHTQRTDNPHSVTKAQVGLGNVENTALSTWTGTNKITTLGTITSGTWRGSKIANAYLENSSLTIAGLAVSLGGSIAAADLAKKFYWANVQLSATSSTETTPTFKSVTIGSVTLSCDADGCLHINKGVYSDSFVSAMGKNAGTASTGISEADMWVALGTDSSTKVIPAEHLDLSGISMDVDLSAYYTSEQIDALLQNKSALGHTHNMSELTNDAGFATTEWVEQQDYATNTALTAGLAKKLDADWFASLFTVYDTDGLKVSPNDYSKTADSIRAMFGFWTDKYLSALGKTDNVAYHEVYLTDEDGNYLLDSDGNYITTTRLLAALEGGVSEDALWSLLAPDGAGEVYATAQIGLEHLTDALKEYVGTLGLGQYALKTDVTEAVGAVQKTLDVHTQRTDNPHSVTKAQVGLGNVENTALSTWTGTSKITTLGTITSGTWRGSKIANAYLENSSLTIAGLAVSLGGSIAAADLAKKFYWANVQLSATSSTETTPTFKTVTIGSVTLSCDSDGCLHIDKGVYSDSFVSAMGKNAGTASTGISEADMWEALGTDSSTQVIPAEHLDLSGVSGGSTDLSGYYTSAQTDALLQNKSALGHKHTKSEITDFPSSLKNPSSLTLQLNGTTKATYDGSSAATVNVTPSAIGAAASSHTHTKSQITDFPTSLKNPSALSWSGYSSGSYDGSAAKTISIPNNTNQLTNGAGYITSSGSCSYATSAGAVGGYYFRATGRFTGRFGQPYRFNAGVNSSGDKYWKIATVSAFETFAVGIDADSFHTSILFDVSGFSWGAGIITQQGFAGYGTNKIPTIYLVRNSSDGTYTVILRVTTSSSGYLDVYSTSSLSITETTAPTSVYAQLNTSTGFGTTSTVSANGTMTASNFIATSDMRLKDVTGEDAVLDAEVIADAPLFRFRWKEREDGTEYIGTSAQYWQERCPQVVCDTDGRLGVDYGALGVAAGVSLAREVVELRAKVQTLEERLARMEAMMSKLMGGQEG